MGWCGVVVCGGDGGGGVCVCVCVCVCARTGLSASDMLELTVAIIPEQTLIPLSSSDSQSHYPVSSSLLLLADFGTVYLTCI